MKGEERIGDGMMITGVSDSQKGGYRGRIGWGEEPPNQRRYGSSPVIIIIIIIDIVIIIILMFISVTALTIITAYNYYHFLVLYPA